MMILTAEGAEGAEEEKRELSTDLVGSNVRAIAYTEISGCHINSGNTGMI